MDRVAARFAVHQRGLLTRGQAHEAGLSDEAIKHRLRTGRWGQMHPGVYRIAGSESSWEQAVLAACLKAGPEAVTSHRAAAVMWGVEGIEPVIEVTVSLARHPRMRGVVVHRTDSLLLPERTRLRQVPLTTPVRTVFDLAAVLPRGAVDRVLEDALSRRLFPRQTLVELVSHHGRSGRTGVGVVRDLLEGHPERWERAESRLERRLLRYLKAHQLPEPVLQFEVKLPNGRTARLDFAYPDRLVALEADSYRWHTSRAAWARYLTRNRTLTTMGWQIIPVTWEDVTRIGDSLAEELKRLLWTSDRA